MGADGEVSRCLAPPTARPSPLAKCPLRRQTPKVGAECPNRARSDLCGGRSVMGIPTAIDDGMILVLRGVPCRATGQIPYVRSRGVNASS